VDAEPAQRQRLPVTLEPRITTGPIEPQAAFLELGRIRFDDIDMDGVLLRVAQLAQQTVPGTADVSVTLVRDLKAFTAAFTGEDALRLDESQYAPGYGPCLDVAQASGSVRIVDMAQETRWPEFTQRALHCGVHSSLSVALPVQQSVVGALNLYAHAAGTFDDAAVELAQTFAGYAAVAITNAHLVDTNTTLADNMRRAMETRAVIEQAKGIVMAELRCDATTAFEVLTRRSQTTNRKLRDVASDIVAGIAPRST
jgi:GAF domain-containing protein